MIPPTNYSKSFRSKTSGKITMNTAKQKAAARKLAERTPDKNMRRRQSTLQMFAAKSSDELRDLFWAAEYGDTPGVENIVTQNPAIDADAADAFGRTAIHIAVVNEHAEIVELLLDKSNPVNLYEALLLAINHNYENITELILKHPTYRQYHNRWPELAAKLPEASPFSDDISPIILACQKNLFGIVHLLWQEGMRVPVPHDFACTCERCAPERDSLNGSRDQLKHAKRRLNEYRALTSEAYISLTSTDPFQTAFELSRQMERRATQEKHFKREYKELVHRLSCYVVKLLDNIRTHSELQTILNSHSIDQTPTALTPSSPTLLEPTIVSSPMTDGGVKASLAIKSEPLARLRVAIKYKQKDFVAHWSCQQELMRRWLRGFNQHQGAYGQWKMFLYLTLIILGYPFLMFFHWFVPNSEPARLLTRPLVRFVSYSASYILFLALLCVITVTPLQFYNSPEKMSEILGPNNNSNVTLNDAVYQYCKAYCGGSCIASSCKNDNDCSSRVTNFIGELPANYVTDICSFGKDFVIRPRCDNVLSWMVSIWLVGLLFRKIFEAITRADLSSEQGFRRRWDAIYRSPFDLIDYVVLAVFAIAFLFRFYSYSKTVKAVGFFLSQPLSNTSLPELPIKLYWLNADRYYFHPLDPLTISELSFAVGAVFSFSRLLYIFPVLEVFGPCYLALTRVVNDIFAFFFVFLVVFAAFMIGTMNVYWYFNAELRQMLQLNSSYNPDIPAEQRFGDIELTFRTVFWSLFGLGESDYMNLQNFANGSMIWVERIGYIMYGGYSVVCVCVLLNMLIAMMANSYESVNVNSEMEWKYARTILFLEYIPDYSPTVPTPFNLIPNPRYITETLHRLFKQLRLKRLAKSKVPINETLEKEPPKNSFLLSTVPLTGEATRQQKTSAAVSGLVNPRDDLTTLEDAVQDFNEAIHKIVRRFIMGLTIQGSSGTVDLEEIKQDISSFRFELFDVLSSQQQQPNIPSPSPDSAAATNRPMDFLKLPTEEQGATINSPSRSPQILRRSFAPYRRRHLVTTNDMTFETNGADEEAANSVANGGSARRLYSSRRLSFKRPMTLTHGAVTTKVSTPPSVRIDRVIEEEP